MSAAEKKEVAIYLKLYNLMAPVLKQAQTQLKQLGNSATGAAGQFQRLQQEYRISVDRSKLFSNATKELNSRLGEYGVTLGPAVLGTAAMASGVLAVAKIVWEAGKALFAYASATTAAGDEMKDFVERTGSTIENAQLLHYAISKDGGSLGELEVGFKTLARQMRDAIGGSKESIDAFSRLGIETKDLVDGDGRLRDLQDILLLVQSGLHGISNHGDKVDIITQLLGRGGIRLLPAFNKDLKETAAEMKRYGLAMDPSWPAKADAYAESVNRLSWAWQRAKEALIGPLIPKMEEFNNAVAQGIGSGDYQRAWNRGLQGVGTLGGSELARLFFPPKAVEDAKKVAGAEVEGFFDYLHVKERKAADDFRAWSVKVPFVAPPQIFDAEAVAKQNEAWAQAREAGRQLLNQLRGSAGEFAEGKRVLDAALAGGMSPKDYAEGLALLTKKTNESSEAGKKHAEMMKQANQLMESSVADSLQQLRALDLLERAYPDVTKRTKEWYTAYEAIFRKLTDVDGKLKEHRAHLKEVADNTNRYASALQQIVQETRQLVQSFARGAMTIPAFVKGMKDLQREFARTLATATNFRRMMVDIFQSIGDSLANSIANAVMDSKAKLIELKEMARSVLSIVLSYAIRLGLSQLPVIGPAFAVAAEGSSGLKSGQPTIVGERGPELVIPRGGEVVIPNHGLAAFAGGGGLTVNLTIPAGSLIMANDSLAVRRLANTVGRVIEDRISRQYRSRR